MGSATFELGECLGSRGNIKAKKIKNGGTLFARVTKAAETNYGSMHLSMRGIKLKNVDGLFSKSDPFFTINTQTDSASGRMWMPVYRSKPVMNNLNPEWEAFSIPMDQLCNGDRSKPILIEVFDWEKSGKHQTMGSFETNVNGLIAAKIMQNPSNPKEVPLTSAFTVRNKKNKDFGKIVVTQASVSNGSTKDQQSAFASQNLAGGTIPDFSNALDVPPPSEYQGQRKQQPQQYQQQQNGTPQKFLTVNGVTKINPAYKKWKAAQQPSSTTSVATTPAPVQTYSQPSASSLQTFSQLSISSLPPPIAPPESALPLPMAPPPMDAPAYSPGTIPKFVDYLGGGCEINLAVAIDFTGSNGDPRVPGTLHYMHADGQLNDYEKAITAVGSVVARYDSDQKFPVWGFGAKYGGVIQHCFQIGKSAELDGVGGIIEGYRQTFRTGLVMSGPTVFAEVISRAAALAKSAQERAQKFGKQVYTILLILTDGAVTDIEQTKHAIRCASDAPLSIVIVGIGSDDFSNMQFLDDFQQSEGGSTRDIVQFVEFSRYKDNKRRLTQETLDEIPDQLVGYFYGRGIMPSPPAMESKRSIYEEDCNEEDDIDLSMAIGPNGKLVLENEQQAYYNGNSYGKLSSFLPPSMAPNYQAGPPVPSYGHGAISAGQSYGYGGGPSSAQSYVSYGAPTGSQPVGSHGIGAPYVSRPVPTAPSAPELIFYVRAPPNSYPGMQIQVKNPSTGRIQIVVVPSGVPPGGTFGVKS